MILGLVLIFGETISANADGYIHQEESLINIGQWVLVKLHMEEYYIE